MAAIIGKAAAPVAKKFLNDEARKHAGVGSDPYYEYRVIDGKMKKVKKDIPDFIPAHDADILGRVQKRAHRYDACFRTCGFSIGWSSIWGLLPEVGDIIDLFMAIRLAILCNKIKGGLPLASKAWIYFIIMVDFLAGLVPVFGDIIDIGLKANLCTVATLERHLYKIHDPNSNYNRKRRDQGLSAPPLSQVTPRIFSEKPPLAPTQPRPIMQMRAHSGPRGPPGAYNSKSVPIRFAPPLQQDRFRRFADPAAQLAKPMLQSAKDHAASRPDRHGWGVKPPKVKLEMI